MVFLIHPFELVLATMPRLPHRQVAILAIVLAVCVSVAYARDCTQDDWVGEYTVCQSGRRHFVYFLKPGTDCTGSANKPADIYNVPCGMYLD